MSISEIEEIARNYLRSKGIRFEREHEKDKCHFKIKRLNDVFYISCTSSYFQGYLQPGDKGYPAQAGGFECASYRNENSYCFVCNANGNIIIDLNKINTFFVAPKPSCELLDEENILVPIKGTSNVKGYENNYRHFRIQNGEAKLINIFEGKPPMNESL